MRVFLLKSREGNLTTLNLASKGGTMLLIIDNQSSFIKSFKRNFLSEQDFDYIFFDHNQPLNLSTKTEIKGIILSGGKGSPYEPLNLTTNFVALINFDVPILGICLGHEIIAAANMARIKKLNEPQRRREKISIIKPEDPIFKGLEKSEVYFTRRHSYYIADLPKNFIRLGESDICENEILKHIDKPIYGFQSHPEVSGKDGLLIMKNFLRICGFDL